MVLIVLVLGCSHSNQIYDSWVNPDATKESIKFKKVAVFALVLKSANRKYMEDAICARLVNTVAVPSYKIVDDNDMQKSDLVKTQLTEKGFDGALILRLIDVNEREAYSPGVYPSYYYSFGGYYGYTWGYMYMYDSGGAYITDKSYTAEVNIYSLKDDKLMWSGETISVNPESIQEVVSEISESVKNKLISDGLLEPSQN
jgi:hypothetical protein